MKRWKVLQVAEVEGVLTNPDLSKIITEPPVNPKGGDVYLYSWASNPNCKDDWRCDQLKWKHAGVRIYPTKANARVRKFYHHCLSSRTTFTRHAFHLVNGPSTLVLIQYLGDASGVQEDEPHGNAMKQPTRPHVRTCPSVLHKIAEKADLTTPQKIYRKLTASHVAPSVVPAMYLPERHGSGQEQS